jgi:hypothetical protein
LISITIANYAVSASYLGRETRLTRRRLEKRKDQLDMKVKELQAKGKIEIEDLKKEIKEAEKERNRLGQRIIFLSWIGAVIIPSLFFIISLLQSMWGMNIDTDSSMQLFTSSFFLACGFAFLLVVIGTIDSAARQVPIPEFEVYFKEKAKTLKLKNNEQTEIAFYLENIGEDIAENLVVFLYFPSGFKIYQDTGLYDITKQGIESNYPNYFAVIISQPLQHPDTTGISMISLTAPKINEKYEIPIVIYERKTGKTECKLDIEVTD